MNHPPTDHPVPPSAPAPKPAPAPTRPLSDVSTVIGVEPIELDTVVPRAAVRAVPAPVSQNTAPPACAPAPELGHIELQSDRYEILSEIARGGMGIVYKARQTGINRIVALKMILTGQLAGADEKQRFLAEATVAGQLEHPHIVPIYEVGEIGGQPFFSMLYVEGTSLRAMLANGPMIPSRAAECMRQVAEAVHYAHTRGVIHRDLKPANVLIDRDGSPWVTDFGLAKRTATAGTLTPAGQILGTPNFMPPEQAAGRLDHVGPLSDVYSLGAMLYNLLSGHPPFHGPTVTETLLQVMNQKPAPLRQIDVSIPADLETICAKCLQKEPAQRYESAAAFAEDLKRFLRREPIEAKPDGWMERGWRWWRKNPGVAGLGAAAVVLAVTVAGMSVQRQPDNGQS